MLRITQQSSAEAARSYYSAADYLKEGREVAGTWHGKGAKQLGLEGPVTKEAFDRMCENQHPLECGPLTVRKKEERTVGYDFTWSVPKSVSLLYALTQDERLLDAFRSSVRESMQEIEGEMKTRIRKQGQNAERVTGNMAWAEFVHFTSRPVGGVPDPQLHAHCFVFNSTWDASESRWKAGQFRDLKRDAPYWQAAFRVRLANQLQALGYAVERKRDDFEIGGIPASALKKFARRTALIEEHAATAAIGDVRRFPDPRKLVSYLGLNPSVHQSGEGPAQHGRITKQGRGQARGMLVEAAWAAARSPGPFRAFYQRIAARRGKHIAAVAIARKLAMVIWHMLTKETDYIWPRPALLARKFRAVELRAGLPTEARRRL